MIGYYLDRDKFCDIFRKVENLLIDKFDFDFENEKNKNMVMGRRNVYFRKRNGNFSKLVQTFRKSKLFK